MARVFKTKKAVNADLQTVKSGVSIEGLPELERALARLGDNLAGEILSKAVGDGAEVFAELMRALAPEKSGDLRDSIVTQEMKREPGSAEWGAGPGRLKRGAPAEGFHGMFQELGTVYMPAQPFIRPSFDEGKDEAAREIATALARAVFRG